MSVRLLLTDEAWAEIAPILTAIKSRAGSPPAQVQGVWLNQAIFAPEEVIFLDSECRMDKSVLLKTEML